MVAKKKASKKKVAKKKTAKKKVVKKVEELRISYEPLSKLKRAKRNPKNHDGRSISGSIKRFGYNDPMTINERTGKLVTGHGRLDQLTLMHSRGEDPPNHIRVDGKEWFVPVLRGVSFKNEKEAEAYLLAHNQTSISGGWNATALADMFGDIENSDFGFDGLGFSKAEVSSVIEVLGGITDSDEAPEDFKEVDDQAIETDHECPKCGYKFS